MPNDTLPDWEHVRSSAPRLQRILPDAVLVGGTHPDGGKTKALKTSSYVYRMMRNSFLVKHHILLVNRLRRILSCNPVSGQLSQ
jgi:hypothetical protein